MHTMDDCTTYFCYDRKLCALNVYGINHRCWCYKLFSLLLMFLTDKLKCLSWAWLSSLVLCLRVRPGSYSKRVPESCPSKGLPNRGTWWYYYYLNKFFCVEYVAQKHSVERHSAEQYITFDRHTFLCQATSSTNRKCLSGTNTLAFTCPNNEWQRKTYHDTNTKCWCKKNISS
jgi:hypothetical protein